VIERRRPDGALRPQPTEGPPQALAHGLAGRERLYGTDGEQHVAEILRQVEPAQEFGKQGYERAADDGAFGISRPGHGRDREQHQRAQHGEIVGDQGAEVAGEQAARHPGDEGADGNRPQLGGRDADAVRRCGALGMADREPGRAQPRSGDQFETTRDQREDDQHEQEVALVRVETLGALDLLKLRLAGKRVGGKDRVEGAGEAECDDGEIDAAQAQRWQPDGYAERHGREAADDDPERQAARRAGDVEIADRPGTDAGEGELA
jgi:hypothetical protein